MAADVDNSQKDTQDSVDTDDDSHYPWDSDGYFVISQCESSLIALRPILEDRLLEWW